MKDAALQKLKTLKQKFRELETKQREQVSVCFLKVKLGVHSTTELNVVKAFLDNLPVDLSPENLDHVINYFHSESHTLPEFLAMEDSVTEVAAKAQPILPKYNADDVETLKELVPPFKTK